MLSLSLRLRVFLMFAGLTLSGVGVVVGALWVGFNRTAAPEALDGFASAGIFAGFGLLGIMALVWWLFDENVAKPIERLSTSMRLRAHSGVAADLDLHAARYLGDLAPAASGLADQAEAHEDAVASETARLSTEAQRLTKILSAVPQPILLAGPTHHIALYDAQAAQTLSPIARPRLGAALTDYVHEDDLKAALAHASITGGPVRHELRPTSGAAPLGAQVTLLGPNEGYVLVLEAEVDPAQCARPLVYDFEMLNRPSTTALDTRPLSELSFTVFDTETTGLDPQRDHVVQIGAVRVLNGRIVESEIIDQLVHPGRPIPPVSTRVHGVSDAMVADAPGIADALPALHELARDSVIVAHNAPFDIAFLRREEGATGLRWDHPILDTVLLSAIVFGTTDSHTLDALCARLNIAIPEALRHTALGDAHATAQAVCCLLPMLEARGIRTLGDVIAETRKHGRLLQDLNPGA